MAIGFLCLACVIEGGLPTTRKTRRELERNRSKRLVPQEAGPYGMLVTVSRLAQAPAAGPVRFQAPVLADKASLTCGTSGPNPNTLTSLGSPKEEIRRMPALVTVSTQIPYGR